jgi:uncharacterized membrane protein YjgN (DUF898 family)
MGAIDAIDRARSARAADSLGHAGEVHFLGTATIFRRILIRGAVLLLLTLGIYRFWLVTDIRRFLWANTRIAGDGLEYVGTAGELLLGFLMAIAILIPLYAAVFISALDLGLIRRVAGILAFALLALLGQFAIYRARRYRLTRTVFRGLRFHQTGSAWRYAVCALFWWVMTIVTLGLAYPWGQASLERYKLSHTFYGNLGGRFEGSGTQLFVRGFLMWLLVVGPSLIGVALAIRAVDWAPLAEALSRGGDDVLDKIEGASPGFAAGLVLALFAFVLSGLFAAALYPAFQALALRWWTSGVRFGEIAMASRLPTASIYRIYFRLLWYSLLLGLVVVAVALIAWTAVGLLDGSAGTSKPAEFVQTVAFIGIFIVTALAYSTMYQVIVKLSLWRLGFESVDITGLAALDRVKAVAQSSTAMGEGLADALNVASY